MKSIYRTKNGGFLHGSIAEAVGDKYQWCEIGTEYGPMVYLWYDGKYTEWGEVYEQVCREIEPEMTSQDCEDVWYILDHFCCFCRQFDEADKFKVALNDGILDLRTMKFFNTDEPYKYAIVNKIDLNYADVIGGEK